MKLIDKDALLNRLQNDPLFDLVETYGVSDVINAEPTVDAVPVKHGKWIDRNGAIVAPFWERYECSECGARSDNSKYCPNCGAKMERKDE